MAERDERRRGLEWLRRCVDDYLATRNPTEVLDPGTLRRAQELAAATGPDDRSEEAFQVRCLLGWLHSCRYDALPEGESQADLRAAMELLRPAYARDPASVPPGLRPLLDLSGRLDRLEGLLRQAADGRAGAVGEALALARDMVDEIPEGAYGHVRAADYLGVALGMRYKQTGDVGLLDEAVEVWRGVVAALPRGMGSRVGALLNLENALQMRFEADGRIETLHQVFEVVDEILAAAPGDDARGDSDTPDVPDVLSARLCRLGDLLWERSGEGSDPRLLPELARCTHLTVAAAGPEHPERGRYAYNLALALYTWSGRTGDPATGQEALDAAQRAVAAPGAHPAYERLLGDILQMCARRTGDVDLFTEAVAVQRRVLDATPERHPERGGRLNNLATALRGLADHTGDLDALREAIDTHAAAVAATPADHRDYGGRVTNHGVALWRLYQHTGDLAVLREAVQVLRHGVDATPLDHPERAGYLTGLGVGLRALGTRLDDPGTLRAAVEAHEAAVAAMPEDHPDRPGALVNLGAALQEWCERAPDDAKAIDELCRAVDVLERALDATPPGGVVHLLAAGNLGTALHRVFERTGETAALRRAVEMLERAAEATPADDPARAAWLAGLAGALEEWSRAGGGAEAAEEALARLREVARLESTPTSQRVRVSRWWGRRAAERGRLEEAREAYDLAIGLLPRLLPGYLRRRDQEYRLSHVFGLGAAAAACALQEGDPVRALELAEHSRGVLLAQALDLRDDLSRLQRREPDLAERFDRLRHRLEAPSEGMEPGRPAAPRLELVRRWEGLIAEIRAVPGFEGFLRAHSAPQLRPAASGGPVVTINVDGLRSDALILTTAGVSSVPLPDLRSEDLEERMVEFQGALREAHDGGLPERVRAAAQQKVGEALGWVWDVACGPVLDALDLTRPPADGEPWPRVWWIPTGLLTYFPLHAAGHHTTRGDRRPRTVIDRVVSSYTPTVRALARARERAVRAGSDGRDGPAGEAGRAAPRRVLTVAMPHTPGAPDLPWAERETRAVAALLPGGVSLGGDTATRQRVLDELPRHPWVHFACHGAADVGDPSVSHLLLHDGALRVMDVAQLWLQRAELAYLSACETYRGGVVLADEAVHLGGAFFLAGYTHVIATYWPIFDEVAAHTAASIYRPLASAAAAGRPLPDGAVATAVHNAVRGLRDPQPEAFVRWAPYAHIGP